MESRFAHLYKRDNSVSMIRVKMSRRRSQTQKENRKRMQNHRRHLDQLPELEISMDVSTLEKSVAHAQGTVCKAKAEKINGAAEERKKMLERFKENKALQKEKERREKEKKGVFKVSLYHPQPLGYLPLNPVMPSTAKTTESMRSTRVTRSMKQQQQPKLPPERQAAPKKAEPIVRAPTTRSTARSAANLVPAKATAKPTPDQRAIKTRSANRQLTATSAGSSKPMQDKTQGETTFVTAIENKHVDEDTPTVHPSPVKEKMEENQVTPTSFAPQGFVFQPPSGLKIFQPAPLSPRTADTFLSPSFCLDTKVEFTIPSTAPCNSTSPVPSVSPPAPSVSSPCPPAPISSPCASVEPQHDVPYFRHVMADETERLSGLSELWESRFDDSSIPEEMRDRMRTAVGQARLLMKERFGQFSGLVDDCDLGRGEKITTCSDLQGFWDMVYFQVEDVNKKFNALKEAEARGWQEEISKPDTKQKRVIKKPPVAGGKTGAGAGASAAAKSRLAAVKAAMKAKQAAEKAAAPSDNSAPVTVATTHPLPAQTVVFQGGFFRVESPVKVVGSPRVRLSAASLSKPSPFLSKLNTPGRQFRSAISHSSPNPCMTVTSTEAAPPTSPPAEMTHLVLPNTCTPRYPSEDLPCSPKPLQNSTEHHNPNIHASPTAVTQTDASQPFKETSDHTGHDQADLANAAVNSPMQESSEIKPHSSPHQSEAELPLHLLKQSDINTEAEECIQKSSEATALSQDQSEEPMVNELDASMSVSPGAAASPAKVHTLSFALSPSPSKTTYPQAEMVGLCASTLSSPFVMSTTPPRLCVPSPAQSDSTSIPVNESSSIGAATELTENPEAVSFADLEFERYLQPTTRCSLSPVQSMAVERFSLGVADAEMESPQSQAEETMQDAIMTPTALPRMAPLVFTPWTEQPMDNVLPFTPEQRDRVRQSVCNRDLMMFTPPSSK
ncbi:disks large-associated protein 5 isoform X2 [Hoplias malabaricus]|uniref:disks large-associated protein 5 isoform X2 n=1 Tax=Hoplias malabaricus TaxID=27720 RepID=UPI003462AAB5